MYMTIIKVEASFILMLNVHVHTLNCIQSTFLDLYLLEGNLT
jgi:hypothetical protein